MTKISLISKTIEKVNKLMDIAQVLMLYIFKFQGVINKHK